MKEKPKSKKVKEREVEKSTTVKPEIGEESSWSKDQKKRGYYYDDAYGYKVYNPDEEDEEQAEQEDK